MSRPPFDKSKRNAFQEKINNDVAAMMLGNLAYIGDQLGLFKTLSEHEYLTADQLAKITNCNARYVREWLSAMAAAEWIEYDGQHDAFILPLEHINFLANEASPAFMGGLFDCIIPFASVAPQMIDCFRNGGGITLTDHHPKMHNAVARMSGATQKKFLTQVWLAEYMVDAHQKLTVGGTGADVGCGSGQALLELAKAYPQSQFIGYEPDPTSAARAKAQIAEAGVSDRVNICQETIEAIPENGFDFIMTYDVIHDLPTPQAVINDIYRGLKPDGTYFMVEVDASQHLTEMLTTQGKMLYSISTMYCLTGSLAHDGIGIGTCMGEELPRQMCAEAGFSYFRRLEIEKFALYEIKP